MRYTILCVVCACMKVRLDRSRRDCERESELKKESERSKRKVERERGSKREAAKRSSKAEFRLERRNAV